MNSSNLYSRRNLEFLLFEVLNLNELKKYTYFSHHDKETINFVLDTAAEIAKQVLWPSYIDADRNPPELKEGKLEVHRGIHQFIQAFSDAGLFAATFAVEDGGIQLPKSVFAVVDHILGSANNSFIMYTDLAKGVSQLIDSFGSLEQKKDYLPQLLTGQWLGTMCLTEPQAGSSLSAITTSAQRQNDGTFKIDGQKIFISAGDHDVTKNIVHLVLARIEGAPKGTKGISLFIVPKFRVGVNGELMANDVKSIGIYHKMGQQATPAMHLAFGTDGDCMGYLLGVENQGLPQMFQMMNAARLDVGLGGVNIASAAYSRALAYSQERIQGARPDAGKSKGIQVPILQHSDVRRMLLMQKAFVEGTLCFLLQCYHMLDLEKVASNIEEKNRLNDLLELLTPTAKAYGSEMGITSVNQGLQVFGGYGYTKDFPLEQMARDVRIMSIYEGTSGIQAQALLGRQVIGRQRKTLDLWFDWISKDLADISESSVLFKYKIELETQLFRFSEITDYLLLVSRNKGLEQAMSDANLYQEAFAILNIAWQWINQGLVAENKLSTSLAGADQIFYRSKQLTLQYFFHYEMPKLEGIWSRLEDTTVLTRFDPEQELII